jgi:hypothetical protein
MNHNSDLLGSLKVERRRRDKDGATIRGLREEVVAFSRVMGDREGRRIDSKKEGRRIKHSQQQQRQQPQLLPSDERDGMIEALRTEHQKERTKSMLIKDELMTSEALVATLKSELD